MKDELELKRAARKALFGEARSIAIGRSRNVASVTWRTYVEIIPDSSVAPYLKGAPYLKTQFSSSKSDFRKTLYTPSTFRIVVGSAWQAAEETK